MITRLSFWIGPLIYALLVFEMGRYWIAPDPNNTDRLQTLAVMMVFEFIMVHSGVFMAVMPKKISLLFFVPVYGVFALAMNTMAPGNTILWIYLSVVFVRMRFAFSNPKGSEPQIAITISLCAVLIYFALLVSFILNAHLVPKIGLTDQFLLESGYKDSITTGGLLTDMPQVSMAMGVVYFSLLALIEIVIPIFYSKSKSDL